VAEELVSGKSSVKYTPMADPQLVLLAPLHTKLNKDTVLKIARKEGILVGPQIICTEIFSVQLSAWALSNGDKIEGNCKQMVGELLCSYGSWNTQSLSKFIFRVCIWTSFLAICVPL
jgi:hypothetical protein